MRLISMLELRTEKGINYSRAHIYRLIKCGFPKPIKLGASRIAFVEEEIDQYLAAKMRERDRPQEAAHAAAT